MLITEKIEVNKFYTSFKNKEFFGFIPVLDDERHGYYTVEVLNESVHKRVSPVYGFECTWGYFLDEMIYDTKKLTKEEFKSKRYKGSYDDYLIFQELIKEEIQSKPYALMFVGCDDGDCGMRFKDKETALKFLETVEYFDDVYFSPLCKLIN